MANSAEPLGISFIILTVLGFLATSAAVLTKFCRDFSSPKLWKYSLIVLDIAHVFLSAGLVLFFLYMTLDVAELCEVSSFFIQFGLIEVLFALLTTAVILLGIQNPGKNSKLSSFHRNLTCFIVLPEIIVGILLSALPLVATKYFNYKAPFTVECFPLQQTNGARSAYGILILFVWWLLITAASVCNILSALKVWKFHNRINSAQNNVWQNQLVVHGKLILKLLLAEHILWLLEVLVVTVLVDVGADNGDGRYSWVVMTTLALATVLHGVCSNVGNTMWSSCCCRAAGAVEEPHRKLKKLELIRIDAPGKLRMKATWHIGKGATKRGLMKVYGGNHLKTWAQEIVILGMLRRAQHPSLIQCLWTNSSNPYYETMTLISGEIITSDSRIICLEQTNGGTLQEFLHKVELPLPEPCQRMIVHDIAEGLFYLHHQNVLHSNLTSSCIYLKGSLQSMVLRAAVGDFEDAEIYGTLQQSTDSNITDKRHFFLPDIRSFALVALEMVSRMCEKKFQNRYVNYDTDAVPLKLNLAQVISDNDDNDEDFHDQYGYEAEDTDRMFDSLHPDFKVQKHTRRKVKSPDPGYQFGQRTDSLENLMDKERPTSPGYTGLTATHSRDNFDANYDDEVAQYSVPCTKEERRVASPEAKSPLERCKSPDRNRPLAQETSSKRKIPAERTGDRHEVRLALSGGSLMPVKPEQDRGASPDPMKDAKLQELRNRTESKLSKKERKISFRRQKKDVIDISGQAFEAFATMDEDKGTQKRKDAGWLLKPTSILKSITSSDTAVSVFKAKSLDDDNHLQAIEEEEIDAYQNPKVKRTRNPKLKERSDSEVWTIIDEQYYNQVNKRAASKLKKTVSGESRSSLWSFISTPEDMDSDDQLDDIIENLPGMAEPDHLRKSKVTVGEIMAERERSLKTRDQHFSYDGPKQSRFELIDYYEMLKARKITMDDVPVEKREMLQNVIELKREEKVRREEMKHEDCNVIRSDEMYNDNLNPGGSQMNPKGKIKVVSFRRNQQAVQERQTVATEANDGESRLQPGDADPRQQRARSAPLKRPRTPMQKQQPSPAKAEVNALFNETKTHMRRTRARSALRRALNKSHAGVRKTDRDYVNSGDKPNLALKYATVKKLNAVSEDCTPTTNSVPQTEGHVLTVPVPTSESFSLVNPTKQGTDIKRFSSFSSNDSSSSFASSITVRRADVSLTSGELTSLSSQAESDHFEPPNNRVGKKDGKSIQTAKRKMVRASRVDSGFDSGSMSSEMSDAYGHSKKYYTPVQNSKTQNSLWTRTADYIPNSPSNFSSKFMPPVDCLPEEQLPVDGMLTNSVSKPAHGVLRETHDIHREHNGDCDGDDDSGILTEPLHSRMAEDGDDAGPAPKIIEVSSATSKETFNLSERAMSPVRPLSPDGSRLSHGAFAANVALKPERPLSPMQTRQSRPTHTKSAVSAAPTIHVEMVETGQVVSGAGPTAQSAQMASKRYRELVKQGVPLRASVIDSSPTRQSPAPSFPTDSEQTGSRPGSSESNDAQELFATLDSNGFFGTRSPTPKATSPTRNITVMNGRPTKPKRENKRKNKRLPLEQIVSETPQQPHTREVQPKDSNHLSVSEDVYLNQPTSEDSETCSIRTTKSSNSTPSGTKPKVVVDAELVIDRIFYQNSPQDALDVEVEAALGLDQDPLKAVNNFYSQDDPNEYPNLNTVPLLKGTSQKHVEECMDITSHLHVATMRDLLPASEQNFGVLRKKLQQVGQLGTVGNQLMDVIQKCWLQDMPPSSGDLVEQLTDPVTETEV